MNVRTILNLVSKFKYRVEDHGNGFMVIRNKHNSLKWPKFQGVTPEEARAELSEYIGKKKAQKHAFARPMLYNDKSACWLSTAPGEFWEGAERRSDSDLPYERVRLA